MSIVRIIMTSATLIFAAPAQAQDFSMPVVDYVGGWMRTNAPDITMDQASGGSSAVDLAREENAAKKKSSNSRSGLSYTVSLSRRQANQQHFLSTISGGAQLAEVDLIGVGEKAMLAKGLNINNIADAFTIWSVVSWKVANRTPIGDNPAIYQGVKKQAVKIWSNIPELENASDGEKQIIAEELILKAILLDYYYETSEGDPAGQAELSKSAVAWAKAMGLDLPELSLTEQGFMPRRK